MSGIKPPHSLVTIISVKVFIIYTKLNMDSYQDLGFKSKKRMKVMLRWMKERHRLKVLGTYKCKKVDDEDFFRYATIFYNEASEKFEKP